MSLLSKLLPVANVILDLDVTSKKRVFEHVGLLFENALGVGRGQVFDALFARERLGSTGLGHGIAIPHSVRVNGRTLITITHVESRARLDLLADAIHGR